MGVRGWGRRGEQQCVEIDGLGGSWGLGDIRGFSGLTRGKLPLGRQINPYGGGVSDASKLKQRDAPGSVADDWAAGVMVVDRGKMRGREEEEER